MTHEARDAGHPEPGDHDCTCADRNPSPGAADQRTDDESDAYVSEARLKAIDTARRRLPADRNLLDQPMEVPFIPAILDRADRTRLVHWLEYDPEHPIMHFLELVPVPERGQWMLTCLERSVVGSRFFMFGLVDDHVVGNHSALYDLLLGYLVGVSDQHPLRRWELPTSVMVPVSCLEPVFVRELVFAMVEPGREADVVHETRRLTRPWCDPDGRDCRLCPDIADLRKGIRRASLERWWAVVSNPDHVRAELDALPAACERGAAEPHHPD